MLKMPEEGQTMISNVQDEHGNGVGFVNAIDEETGFILVYNDLAWDETENKFKVKSMKVKRIYGNFKIK